MTHRRLLVLSACVSPISAKAGFWDTLTSTFSSNPDVIVVGAGAAGLAAAVEAADAGAKVLVLEKQHEIGGNTLKCGGFYAAVDPERQHSRHISDSYELFFEQTYDFGGRKADPSLVHHMVDHATEGLHWLESLGMQFKPDVFELYGAHWPRTHIPTLPLGEGYIRTLSTAALSRGVEIVTDAQVTGLLTNKGRINGVQGKLNGQNHTWIANKAVILASGSFAANKELIAQYNPKLSGLTTNNTAASTGEVMMAAHRVGAALVDMEYIQCLPGCPPGKKHRVRFHNDVSRFIFVNRDGNRFVREDDSRSNLRDAVLALPERYCYILIDNAGFEEADILMQKELVLAIEADEAWKADSIEELAQKMGISPQHLRRTVDAFNDAVKTKHDPLGRSPRELRHQLNTPPFYASFAGMTIHYTEGGLAINVKAQCLDASRRPIPGLYAAGAVTGGVHGNNRLGANGLADAIVFGRTAGKEAATDNSL